MHVIVRVFEGCLSALGHVLPGNRRLTLQVSDGSLTSMRYRSLLHPLGHLQVMSETLIQPLGQILAQWNILAVLAALHLLIRCLLVTPQLLKRHRAATKATRVVARHQGVSARNSNAEAIDLSEELSTSDAGQSCFYELVEIETLS